MARRFPAPWRTDKIPGGYVVRDANGHALAYVYSRENEAEARQAKVLTKDEARRITVNIARLPELVGKRVTTARRLCTDACGPGGSACNFQRFSRSRINPMSPTKSVTRFPRADTWSFLKCPKSPRMRTSPLPAAVTCLSPQSNLNT
jgi:hypothetical protein